MNSLSLSGRDRPSDAAFRNASSSGNSCRFFDFSRYLTASSWKSTRLPTFTSSASEGMRSGGSNSSHRAISSAKFVANSIFSL